MKSLLPACGECLYPHSYEVQRSRIGVLRLLCRLFDAGVLAVMLGLMVLAYMFAYGRYTVHHHSDLLILPESSVITASDGTLMGRFSLPGSGYRQTAKLQEMPELLIQAFIAVEDRRFYDHAGLDYKGILRACVNNLASMRLSEGGSSITQQLARSVYLNRDRTIWRKLSEASIAVALERQLSKNEILELYLNEIYMGRGMYGVKSAAERYFGVTDLKRLEIWQIAILAGIPKGPSIYNPVDHPGRSLDRRSIVLDVMRRDGLITDREMKEAAARKYNPLEEAGYGPSAFSYMDASLREASRATGIPENELRKGGYTIETAMSRGAQSAMEQAFSRKEAFPPDVKSRKAEAAMVIINHHSGEIVAMMGGRTPRTGGLNRAVLDARQPGSAFKPIIAYGPALESGRFTPDSLLPDRPYAYGSYRPQNINKVYAGQLPMREALRKSVNAPAVWLLRETGLDYARQFASRLGIKLTDEDNNLSVALGGLHKGVSPLKLAQAYSVFASGGIYREAHTVRQITDRHGTVVYKHVPEESRAISTRTAGEMTAMLRDAVQEGTGIRAQMSRPVAGKTGTTELGLPGTDPKANRDIWFVGYTPEWTAAVWMGFDRTDRNHYITAGSGTAAALFSRVMESALRQARR
ncbi:penicillin-binding protein 2A [Paenibacillus forsythiae]|uniref:Penicillin-binding protein 2A n=1 Tax=Paenibacillus forsythiae TaxID=365616 RepID=A0ABU3HBA6_9BACL|nr:PBP1A family penicillin-binding protein [Paenibacillus forsythiae]MDT3428061.1 penicillin-binding protein 2A [Paenibacillus forsythiae]